MKKMGVALCTAVSFVTASAYATSQPGNQTLYPTTRASTEIGITFSAYRYEEPEVMSSKGKKIGLDFAATQLLSNARFFRVEFRQAFGMVDYSSYETGSAEGQPDWYMEARALIGQDWIVDNAVFAPYAGLGYRYLFNDARGISSTGNWGYRRESNYIYMPIGIMHRSSPDGRTRWISTLEYDQLLVGVQISRLSDGGQGHGDLTNRQTRGYGVKMSLMVEKDKWAMGPYAHYWNISQSAIVTVYRNGMPISSGWEPKNSTTEFGFKVSQKF